MGGALWGQIRDKSEAHRRPVCNRPLVNAPGSVSRADEPVCRKRPQQIEASRRIYARYSSRFQHSINDQVHDCRRWAEEHDIEVPEKYVFKDERQSGRKSRRKDFMDLMAAVRAGEVDVVIIFVTSRLFRKTYKTLKFVEEEIVDRRIRCVFVKSGIDTADTVNWRKLLHVHGLVDELTIQLQVAHIQAAHEGQLRAGIVFGTLTYGYTGEVCDGPNTKLGSHASWSSIPWQGSGFGKSRGFVTAFRFGRLPADLTRPWALAGSPEKKRYQDSNAGDPRPPPPSPRRKRSSAGPVAWSTNARQPALRGPLAVRRDGSRLQNTPGLFPPVQAR